MIFWYSQSTRNHAQIMDCAATVSGFPQSQERVEVNIMAVAAEILSSLGFRSPDFFVGKNKREWKLQQKRSHDVPIFNLFYTLKNTISPLLDQHHTKDISKLKMLSKKPILDVLKTELTTYLQEEVGYKFYENGVFVQFDSKGIADLVEHPSGRGLLQQQRESILNAMRYQSGLSQTRAERYAREASQLKEVLNIFSQTIGTMHSNSILQQFSETPPPGFVKYQGALPINIAQHIPEEKRDQANKHIFVGDKIFIAMPYSPAYTNDPGTFLETFQIGFNPFLPPDKQFFVLLQQFKGVLTNQEIIEFMRKASSASDLQRFSSLSTQPSEQELMEFIVQVAPQFQSLNTQDFFLSLLDADQDKEVCLLTQQQAISSFHIRDERIQSILDCLFDILIEEYLFADDQLSESVLELVSDVVINSLGHENAAFDRKAVWETYKKTFHPKKRVGEFITQTHRDNFFHSIIQASPIQMSQLNIPFVSQASCAAGAIAGGFGAPGQFFNSPYITFLPGFEKNMSTSDLHTYFISQNLSKESLQNLIGEKRFREGWKFSEKGCRNPMCERKNYKQHHNQHIGDWVGECGVCYYCEIKDTLSSSPEKQKRDSPNSTPLADKDLSFAPGTLFGLTEFLLSAQLGGARRLLT